MYCELVIILVLIAGCMPQQVVQKFDPIPERDHYHRSNLLLLRAKQNADNEEEQHSKFWIDSAQQTLSKKLNQMNPEMKAKNVIFFIGDGMSPQTVAATRVYLGDENEYLSFERFPYLGQVKTYCVNRQVPDSACTGTAYFSGVKINYGMLNVVASVPRYTCEYERNNSTEFVGLMKWAQDAGKATGIVTTTRVTHASPAASYAQSANRGWESDAEVVEDKCDPEKTVDIARQLVYNEVSKNFKVVLGGGRRCMLPKEVKDEEGSRGYRLDGRNLIQEWTELHEEMGESAYVWNRKELLSIDANKTDFLLGLFESSHLMYNLEVHKKNAQDMEPTLAEMTEAAIKVLRKNKEGFVLFVEGGSIDLAHHSTYARIALDETAEYSRAIEVARKLTSEDDTLIVVSSDHSHTMTYNGYTKRGQDVLGIADTSEIDGLPYTTLSYANGKGYHETYDPANLAERLDISEYDFTYYKQRYPGTVPLSSETHGGEDVNVYASGPMAHIFVGNYEQTTLPYLMAYAAEIGEYINNPDDKDDDTGAAHALLLSLPTLMFAMVGTLILSVI
ncbi:membrane-bound alkaline phosphatase-like [Toxorhynchites rutilus septentrionalis]|uniref:membrane-bound alkaline phosphatase-like n=1 Tax=Toxorhynchites rutilus septentrionalis TaxID=329112 RepID=UPI00247A6F2F|nr:membrane-bound alkaline phosphatase-like [Toxorhynchites rutilus septentrionalis]